MMSRTGPTAQAWSLIRPAALHRDSQGSNEPRDCPAPTWRRVGVNQVLLTLKPGFCHFFFQMTVFHDKNTMFSHCSALLSLVPDRQNDNLGQPLNLDALYGSVTKTAPVLKTVFTDS